MLDQKEIACIHQQVYKKIEKGIYITWSN